MRARKRKGSSRTMRAKTSRGLAPHKRSLQRVLSTSAVLASLDASTSLVAQGSLACDSGARDSARPRLLAVGSIGASSPRDADRAAQPDAAGGLDECAGWRRGARLAMGAPRKQADVDLGAT